MREAPGVCPAAGRAASRALGSFWGRPARRRAGSAAAPARRGGWGSASPPVLAAWLVGDAGLAGAGGHPGRPALGYPAFQEFRFLSEALECQRSGCELVSSRNMFGFIAVLFLPVVLVVVAVFLLFVLFF